MLTKEILKVISPSIKNKHIDIYLSPLNAAMEEFNINTAPRVAAFIAQVLHESGNLRYTEELATGEAYEYRGDLGNLDKRALRIAHENGSTTGKFYKGHGLIQITGYYNHLKCEAALQIPCTDNPKLLCEPINAARSAAWFFAEHGLLPLADQGKFRRITRIINGGYNGIEERTAYYSNALQVLV